LTAEQKEAALKEALKKRGGPQQKGGKDVTKIARMEKAVLKSKAKKVKPDDYDL
jgi:hypothetical protein